MAEKPETRGFREYYVMLKRTEGIVLKNSLFGEADLIVTYLTRDYGLLKVFAKSPRKIKSRFGSSLEPLTYSNISFMGKEDANLPRLTQSDIIKTFHTLRDDFKRLLNVSEMLELSLKFMPEREPHFAVFKLLLGTLTKLEPDSENALYFLYYKIKFLEISGYAPRLDMCGRCGTMSCNGHNNFYVSHGSIICEKCIRDREGSIRLSDGTVRLYNSLIKWRLSNINRVKAPAYMLSEIGQVINSHVAYILGRSKQLRKENFAVGITP
ncbi:MAG TPA: DNA repair protein RecO [Nitrospiraceae bacterium]|nr:DNA repair protein RecO [Nitrospiraceae bacterium]HCL81389.1 DNA repair protein RecO [Nitrospiraceae bacterium]